MKARVAPNGLCRPPSPLRHAPERIFAFAIEDERDAWLSETPWEMCDFVFVGAGEHPAAGDKQRAEARKARSQASSGDGALADMVDREEVVVDDPFDKVEEPPADEHPASEGASADRPAPVGVRRQRT